MFHLLQHHGIKPWEFPRLTFPWLLNILHRGRAADPGPSRRAVRQLLADVRAGKYRAPE